MSALCAPQLFLELDAELVCGWQRHCHSDDDPALGSCAAVMWDPAKQPNDVAIIVDLNSRDINQLNRFLVFENVHRVGELLGLYLRSVRTAYLMSNQRRWLNKPRYFDDESAEDYVNEQIRHKRIHGALKLSAAISALAAEIGASQWTIANIYRGRIKALRGRLRDAIYRHKIEFLLRQVAILEREFELARQMGFPIGPAGRKSLVDDIAAAHALIMEMRREAGDE